VTDADRCLTDVSKRLLLVTGVVVGLTVVLFALTLTKVVDRFWVSWFVFALGVIGGFVSIQQRLKRLSEPELVQLASSWVHILMSPLFGGIFAVLFYLVLLARIVEGPLFPEFAIDAWGSTPTVEDIRGFFSDTYPVSGEDFAKLGFWAFVSGFSERFMPDLIDETTQRTRVGAGRA
jgi:hypothetical protein